MNPANTSKELATAMYDDFKRKAVDEAKKRAVAQHVDYETFKNMVLVAHLRPIHAPNHRQEDKMMPSWSFGVDGSRMRQQVASGELSADTPTEPPSTNGDFYRDWRRNCPSPDDKYRYLKLCGPATLSKVFKVEVSADVLQDILSVLSACWLSHAGVAEAQQQGSSDHEHSTQTAVPEAKEPTSHVGPASNAHAPATNAAGEGAGSAPAAGPESSSPAGGGAVGSSSGECDDACNGGSGSAGGGALREAAFVVQVLQALSGAGRFSLTIRLLGSATKPMLAAFFDSLQAAVDAAHAAAESDEAQAAEASASGLCSAEQLTALKAHFAMA